MRASRGDRRAYVGASSLWYNGREGVVLLSTRKAPAMQARNLGRRAGRPVHRIQTGNRSMFSQHRREC